MTVDETLLEEVVRRVLTVARPERIILFGSAATGQMTEDSDLDLLIVEPEPADTRRIYRLKMPRFGTHGRGQVRVGVIAQLDYD